MKKNLMLFAVAAMALASCGGGFKQGQGGMLYAINDDKSGPVIKEGDFISVNLIAKTEGDSVLTNSYANGRPIPTLLPKPQYKGDIYAALQMLSEGDSATVKLNVDSMATHGQPKPPGFKGKYVIFQIKVEKVIPKGTLSDAVFQNKVADYFKEESAKLKKAEPAKMDKYIADNKLTVQKTASGVAYVITKTGTGPVPAAGDTVEVNYTGRLLNGKLFDTSIKSVAQSDKTLFNPMNPYKPIKFAVGEKKVIAGWDEGLLLLNKGAKATFVIPSGLAYGEQGYGPIPPFSPLVFEVEMVGFTKPDPNAPKPAAPVVPQVQAQQVPVKK
jgi:FKBP-type peptidyl-prolyl cis-trans isomerase FkpA